MQLKVKQASTSSQPATAVTAQLMLKCEFEHEITYNSTKMNFSKPT